MEYKQLNDDEYIFDSANYEREIKATQSKSIKSDKQPKIKSIHRNHRKRVRDKFLKYGLETFSEFEVLEFLLFHSIPQKDTNEIAHNLIDKFGSLKGVMNAEYYDLMEVKGISEVSAALITLQRELSKYLRTNNCEGISLNTSIKSGKFCCEYFMSHVEENAIVIILDDNSNIIAVENISKGSETETALYSRKVLKNIIRYRATKVMISHNHTNNNPNPSTNDIIKTCNLRDVLKGIDIMLIDHIVCAGTNYISMSERGFI